MPSDDGFEISPGTIRELELLEAALSDVDTEVMAKQYLMSQEIFAQRQKTIAKIPNFWSVIFNNASVDLETAITQPDGEILTAALTSLDVVRPEILSTAKVTDSGLAKYGEPRTIAFKFSFKENKWFTNTVLQKTFYYRYSKDGEAGLVSEPVKINWRPGMDVTDGLTDAAYALWAAQKKRPDQQLDGILEGDVKRLRDKAAKNLPEYKAVIDLLENKVDGALSFFNFFSYRGRWTSAAESKEVKRELDAKRRAALAGQETEDDDEDDDDDDEELSPEMEVETFHGGHEVAVAIAEDIWPGAIDYFMSSAVDTDDLDSVEIDESDDSDNDDDDVEMS